MSHLGRNLNRKCFLEHKVHFSSKTETVSVKSEKQMADKSKIQFIQEAHKLMQNINNPVACTVSDTARPPHSYRAQAELLLL